MTRLTYPKEGLIKQTLDTLDTAKTQIESLMNINFDIPDQISDHILEKFPSITIGFNNDLNNLKEKIKEADDNYKKLNEIVASDIERVTDPVISKRDPIV